MEGLGSNKFVMNTSPRIALLPKWFDHFTLGCNLKKYVAGIKDNSSKVNSFAIPNKTVFAKDT